MVLKTVALLGCIAGWAIVSDGTTTAGEVAGCHGTAAAPADIVYVEHAVAASCGGHHHATRRETRRDRRAERRASRSSCSGRHVVAHVEIEYAAAGCSGH